MNEPPDESDWEEQINALVDGELNDEQAKLLRAAAENDKALGSAINEALLLRQAISDIPPTRAPRKLRRKLQRIPQRQQMDERPRFMQLRWAMVTAVLLIAAAVTINQMWPKEPTDIEIAQARQELNLVLSYLARASRKTRDEIASNMRHGFSEPVTQNTIRVIADQFGFNKE